MCYMKSTKKWEYANECIRMHFSVSFYLILFRPMHQECQRSGVWFWQFLAVSTTLLRKNRSWKFPKISSGRFKKISGLTALFPWQMGSCQTNDFDHGLSKVNNNIWHRCWTPVPNFMKIGLFKIFFELTGIGQNRLVRTVSEGLTL